MKLSRSFWILFSSVLIGACSTPKPKGVSIIQASNNESVSPGDSEFQKRVFASYCRSGKQIKALKTKVRFIAPKAEQGMPLDRANEILANVDREKTCKLKTIYRSLSSWNRCKETECSHLASTYERQQDTEDFYNVDESSTEFQSNAKIFRFDKQFTPYGHKKSVFVSPIGASPIFLVLEREKFATENNFSNKRVYLNELSALFTGYTMMVPKEIQKEIFDSEDCSSESNMNNERNRGQYCKSDRDLCGYRISQKLLGYDESDDPKLTPTAASEDRIPIWNRYFITFTSLKEGVTDDPQVSDYEASLDLNHFCKYARHLDDLISR